MAFAEQGSRVRPTELITRGGSDTNVILAAYPWGQLSVQAIVSCVGPPYRIDWLHNGLEVRGATNMDFTVRLLRESSGSYVARMTDSANQTYESPPLTFTVLDPDPVPPLPARIVDLDSGGHISFPLGSEQSLTVTASGSPSPAIQWQRNGVDLPRATNSVLTFGYVTTQTAGTYRAIVRNEWGEDTSGELFITTSSLPPSVGAQRPPPSYTFSEGASVRIFLPIAVEGNPSPSVSLLRNGTPIDVPPTWHGSYFLELSAVSFSDAGEYSLVVSNVVGSSVQPFVNLKVVRIGSLDHWTRRSPLPQGRDLQGGRIRRRALRRYRRRRGRGRVH